MLCDYLVLAFLGLTSNNLQRSAHEDIGRHISHVLKQVSKHCRLAQPNVVYMPRPFGSENKNQYGGDVLRASGVKSFNDMSRTLNPDTNLDNDGEKSNYGYSRPHHWDRIKNAVPSPNALIWIHRQHKVPAEYPHILNNYPVNDGLIRVPESVLLTLLSPEQLSILYRENHATPVNDPSAPRVVEISARFLSTLIRAKQNLHNAVDHGMNAADNIFDGLRDTADSVTEIIGGGAHGLLDLVG